MLKCNHKIVNVKDSRVGYLYNRNYSAVCGVEYEGFCIKCNSYVRDLLPIHEFEKVKDAFFKYFERCKDIPIINSIKRAKAPRVK